MQFLCFTNQYQMKNFFYSIAIIAIPFLSKAQTTDEIYNYITAGYITTIKQGLDFKKGYNFKEIIKGHQFTGTLSSNTYQFSINSFFKESNPNNTLAFMIILLKNHQVEKVFCLPSYGSEPVYWNKFWKDISLRLYGDQKEQLLSNITGMFVALYKNSETK